MSTLIYDILIPNGKEAGQNDLTGSQTENVPLCVHYICLRNALQVAIFVWNIPVQIVCFSYVNLQLSAASYH